MRLEGRATIPAPRSSVWAFVTDPERVAPCLPGSPSIEKLDARRFRARARVRLGFFGATVVADVEYVELHEPDDAKVRAHGQAPGSSVAVAATLVLADGPDGSTRVDWTAEVDVSGLLAGVGAAQVEETARRMIGEVLVCAGRELGR